MTHKAFEEYDRLFNKVFRKLKKTPSFEWAIVTKLEPLEVILEDSNFAEGVAPDTLVNGLALGDRVLVMIRASRMVVVGRGGGIPDTGWKNITTGTKGNAVLSVNYFKYRVVNGVVEVQYRFEGSFNTGSNALWVDFPAELLPFEEAFGAAWISGSRPGSATIRNLGTVGLFVPAGVTGAASVVGSFCYLKN